MLGMQIRFTISSFQSDVTSEALDMYGLHRRAYTGWWVVLRTHNSIGPAGGLLVDLLKISTVTGEIDDKFTINVACCDVRIEGNESIATYILQLRMTAWVLFYTSRKLIYSASCWLGSRLWAWSEVRSHSLILCTTYKIRPDLWIQTVRVRSQRLSQRRSSLFNVQIVVITCECLHWQRQIPE